MAWTARSNNICASGRLPQRTHSVIGACDGAMIEITTAVAPALRAVELVRRGVSPLLQHSSQSSYISSSVAVLGIVAGTTFCQDI